MAKGQIPPWYGTLKKNHRKFVNAIERLGKAVKEEGPLNEKTIHLVQLAAAASIRSEGAVQSHTRRALEAGAKPEEIYHALVVLTSTIGFPTVSAALSWATQVMKVE